MKCVAMIPARYGSKRLKKKNLQSFDGTTLLDYAIIRAQKVFENDEIWVNGDSKEFESIAEARGVNYHSRPEELGSDEATSEEYINDFLLNVSCDYVIQIHSITPLCSSSEIQRFVDFVSTNTCDTVLSGVEENLECVFQDQPVNFSFSKKTNSQDLSYVFRITWPISAWRRTAFLSAAAKGSAGSYAGRIGYFSVDYQSGIPVKTEEDLRLVRLIHEHRKIHGGGDKNP